MSHKNTLKDSPTNLVVKLLAFFLNDKTGLYICSSITIFIYPMICWAQGTKTHTTHPYTTHHHNSNTHYTPYPHQPPLPEGVRTWTT